MSEYLTIEQCVAAAFEAYKDRYDGSSRTRTERVAKHAARLAVAAARAELTAEREGFGEPPEPQGEDGWAALADTARHPVLKSEPPPPRRP